MGTQPPFGDRAEAVLKQWLQSLEASRLLMGSATEVHAELEGWVDRLVDGSPIALSELYREVALHSRALGADGRPASAALTQAWLLDDAIIAVIGHDAPIRGAVREMIRVVVDAHALGATTRLKRTFAKDLERSSPVVHLPNVAVIGFLIASLQPELIDALMGRLLRASAGAGEPLTILDVSCAPDVDETFHRTLEGFARSKDMGQRILDVTGLRDPDRTRTALEDRGVPPARIRLHADLRDVLPVLAVRSSPADR